MSRVALPDDVASLAWVAERWGVGVSTVYRLAARGEVPGAFKVGALWRVSKVRFERELHGDVGNGRHHADEGSA